MSASGHAIPILVIDDDPTSLELAVTILELDGYEVRTATTAERGLELAAALRPAIILMDLQLPAMTGHEATRRLKADPVTAAIPVVALTAWAMKGDEAEALRAGCDAYLTKPIDTEAFWEMHRRFLGPRPGAST